MSSDADARPEDDEGWTRLERLLAKIAAEEAGLAGEESRSAGRVPTSRDATEPETGPCEWQAAWEAVDNLHHCLIIDLGEDARLTQRIGKVKARLWRLGVRARMLE